MSNSHIDALRRLLKGVHGLPPLSAIEGALEQQCKEAESVIEHYEEWQEADIPWMPENQSDEDLLVAFFHEVDHRAQGRLDRELWDVMCEVIDDVRGVGVENTEDIN